VFFAYISGGVCLLYMQAPAAAEPDAAAFSQVLGASVIADDAGWEHGGRSCPEPDQATGAPAAPAAAAAGQPHGHSPSRNSSEDVLDYREALQGCATI
jgi:hypothetical protein